MKTAEQIALDAYGQEPGKGWAVGSREIIPMIVAAIEADRAQRPDSSELKKAYDRWSDVFEGSEYTSDEQERAVQIELAESLREFMDQIEGGWL